MKIKNTGAKMTLRGIDFPKGKVIDVDNLLAAKCLALPNFVPVVKADDENEG